MKNIATSLIRTFGLAALLAALILSPGKKSYGQLGDLGDLLEGGKDDAELLFKDYLKPFANGFGAGVNTGWVDRARTHGLLGFHVKVNFSAAMVPTADQSFNIDDLGLSTLTLSDNSPSVTPTFAGSSSGAARLGYTQDGLELANFDMPPGTGFSYIMTPMIQAGVGLPRNTDIMVRFIPPFKFLDYGEIYLYGFGLKHELNQWLPGGALMPVTFSVMGGYTAFGTSAGLNARPVDFNPENDRDPEGLGGAASATWDDQEIVFSTNAYTVNLIVGKSLPIISAYGGVGFEGATTNVRVDGNFPYYTPRIMEDGTPKRELTALSDPIDISLAGTNRLRALAGLRISLPLITFNVDYTIANYSMISVGLGISLR